MSIYQVINFSSLCCLLFFIITQKQLYSTKHYTGGSELIRTLISIFGILGVLTYITFFIVNGLKNTFISSIIIVVVSFCVYSPLNKLIARAVLNKMQRNNEFADSYSTPIDITWDLYNRKLDVITTIISVVGIVVNPILAIIMFLLLNK